VAVPATAGVHRKTCSGAVAVWGTQMEIVLAPDVTPVKVPPAAGSTVATAHAPLGTVVEVVVPPGLVVDVVVGVGLVVEVVVETGLVVEVEVTLGRVTGTVATLFASLSSGMRAKGSMRTRSVYAPGGTPVTSRYWQPRLAP
jgi:hypothetical protein